jgi:hypothetical protein
MWYGEDFETTFFKIFSIPTYHGTESLQILGNENHIKHKKIVQIVSFLCYSGIFKASRRHSLTL